MKSPVVLFALVAIVLSASLGGCREDPAPPEASEAKPRVPGAEVTQEQIDEARQKTDKLWRDKDDEIERTPVPDPFPHAKPKPDPNDIKPPAE